ncbi:hypothetical protein ACOMHN_035798 [Nucella lapillus]
MCGQLRTWDSDTDSRCVDSLGQEEDSDTDSRCVDSLGQEEDSEPDSRCVDSLGQEEDSEPDSRCLDSLGQEEDSDTEPKIFLRDIVNNADSLHGMMTEIHKCKTTSAAWKSLR